MRQGHRETAAIPRGPRQGQPAVYARPVPGLVRQPERWKAGGAGVGGLDGPQARDTAAKALNQATTGARDQTHQPRP